MVFLFILFAIVLQVLIFLAHWFLYLTLVRFLGIGHPFAFFSLKIILGILSLTFVSASVLANFSDNIMVRVFYSIAAFWLGTLTYLFLAACFIRLGAWLAQSLSFSLNSKLLAEILFILALAISLYGAINASLVRITRLSISLPNLPPAWQGKTALWVSDIHLGQVRNFNFAENVAAMIRQLHPDIIFIGGDLYDGTPLNLNKVTQPFENLGAPLGTYFITGNHEEFDGRDKFLAAVEGADIHILNNELIKINGLQIIGVDYSDAGSRQNFENILKNVKINPSQPSILLKHAPTDISVAKEAGISLQLSGHAHAGQVFPIGLISHLVYKGYEYGFKQEGNFTIYTSSGTGTWGPPMRVGTTPEIVLIQFKK